MFNQYAWGRYDTEIYGGRCGYIKDITMKGRVTVFLSGKMISTGAVGVSQSIEQLNQTKTLLLEARLILDVVLNPKVQNIVATINLGSRVDFSEYYKIYPTTSMNQKHFQQSYTKLLSAQLHSYSA
jgi:TATA-box binding protein (TBP) (component of TFIID and TFIIIB)